MTIRQNLEIMRNVLRDSTEIAAYCQARYGKKHTVFIGLNPQNPPQKADNPSLSIIGVRVEKAGTREKIGMTIGICVEKETRTDVIPEGGVATKTYEGFLEVEELRELVEKAVITAKKFLLPKTESESIQNEIFPLFTSSTTISIEEVISSRS